MVGILESMLFAGTVFGWPQLVHVLKVEGLYSDLCDGRSSSSSPSNPSLHGHSSPKSAYNASSPLNITALISPDSPPPIPIFNNTRCYSLNNSYDISKSQMVS